MWILQMYTVVKLYIPGVVNSKQMGEVVNDIYTIFN